ncbi:MAG: hypothetical protein IIA55_16520 [Gemmatimonadetes bacterium]|nr:hypothetical protein [Gemmatimonadota bacterium]
MMEPQLTSAERSRLRIFRHVAAEARVALSVARPGGESVRVVRGYIETEGDTERVRNMCIPVRRAYLENDPVNMSRIVAMLRATGSSEIRQRLEAFERSYAPIQNELESASILNDRRITHGEMFEKWIDAMVFHDIPAKRQPFLAMADELGKAVEGIALRLAERIARCLLDLDGIVAAFLGEPTDTVADAAPTADA